MDFERRLEKAIERGQRRGDAKAASERAKALSEEELKRLHSEYRLSISEHIEQCLERLPSYFPGFEYETIYGERGWGAACRRDDVGRGRSTYYSRLELTVRPYTSSQVLELTAKGTVRNKEVFDRKHFERLHDVDPDSFIELVDRWILEYAELFSATS